MVREGGDGEVWGLLVLLTETNGARGWNDEGREAMHVPSGRVWFREGGTVYQKLAIPVVVRYDGMELVLGLPFFEKLPERLIGRLLLGPVSSIQDVVILEPGLEPCYSCSQC